MTNNETARRDRNSMTVKEQGLDKLPPSLTMNISLLVSNASQLKEMVEVCSPGRNGKWLANLIIISISMALQILHGILAICRKRTSKVVVVIRENVKPPAHKESETTFSDVSGKGEEQKTEEVENKKHRNLTTLLEILAFLIIALNIVVAALGIPDNTCPKTSGSTPSNP